MLLLLLVSGHGLDGATGFFFGGGSGFKGRWSFFFGQDVPIPTLSLDLIAAAQLFAAVITIGCWWGFWRR